MQKSWLKQQKLALVMGGGGARGALQAGALRALVEHDVRPDLVVGASAGALNAAFIGLRGWSLATVEALQEIWRVAATADLLPAGAAWAMMRTVLRLPGRVRERPIRRFLMAHGLKPEMRFAAMQMPVYVVVTDLSRCRTLVYGDDPNDTVLDAVEASAALPPWVLPIEHAGSSLMDGGAVSNLPVEPALARGATRIIALDLHDPRGLSADFSGLGGFIWKVTTASQVRETDIELALAAARGVPVQHIHLTPETPTFLWDFGHPNALIAQGYTITQRALERRERQATRWRAHVQRAFSWRPSGRSLLAHGR